MTSSVTFPGGRTHSSAHASEAKSVTDLSVVSRHATAVEVCDMVYGEGEAPTEDAIEKYYETEAVYENPFITATSRSVISDIHSLSRQFGSIDVPRPVAMLCTLLSIKHPEANDRWFQVLKVWTELGDITESDSFDGHRQCMVEHTLNVLLLPGLHVDRLTAAHVGRLRAHSGASNSSLDLSRPRDRANSQLSLYTAASPTTHPTDPGISVPLLNYLLPSPLHFQLHIITRLSFNENGRITHHRDFWDMKDVIGLVPGGSLAQWLASRVAAQGVSLAARMLGFGGYSRRAQEEEEQRRRFLDPERGLYTSPQEITPAAAYARNAIRFPAETIDGRFRMPGYNTHQGRSSYR